MYEVARGPQYDIGKAARKLTLPVQGRTLIFDGESDTTALADFYLHEMRYGGKRIVDVLADSGVELTPDEAELLAAHRNSHCSLFEIVGTDPVAAQIKVRDLLAPGASEISFTDITLSKGLGIGRGDLLFARLVYGSGIHMSAGLFFPFDAIHRTHLINAYNARMRTVAERDRAQRTYIFFYQKSRELGLEHAYQEIV